MPTVGEGSTECLFLDFWFRHFCTECSSLSGLPLLVRKQGIAAWFTAQEGQGPSGRSFRPLCAGPWGSVAPSCRAPTLHNSQRAGYSHWAPPTSLGAEAPAAAEPGSVFLL